MNLKDTLESLIAQAMEDEQELIPTHELPAAKAIAERIEELEKALQNLIWATSANSLSDVILARSRASDVLHNNP